MPNRLPRPTDPARSLGVRAGAWRALLLAAALAAYGMAGAEPLATAAEAEAASAAAAAAEGSATTEAHPGAEARASLLPAAPMAAATAVAGAAVDAITALPRTLQRIERGIASWYGERFHGKPTASGQPFDMHGATAAHRTLPLGSRLVVRNPDNGREVEVLINDRGPFHPGRLIDLSHAAAKALGVLHKPSMVELLQPAEAQPPAPTSRKRR